MKRSTVVFAATALITIAANADINTSAILERGPHHRVVATGNGSNYTELRNGMHYFEGGQWLETEEQFLPTTDGAEAVKGPHKVRLSRNLKAEGAVDLATPDGKRLRATFVGIRYFDASSGNYALLGSVKESQLELLPPNRAIYRDVCDGISADLLLTYTSSGFESDLVLRAAPLPPATYGLDPATTRIEILTEFFSPPVPLIDRHVLKRENDPAKRRKMAEPDLGDETISFGETTLWHGTAFHKEIADSPAMPLQGERTIQVGKKWTSQAGRNILIEATDYSQCLDALNKLPGLGDNLSNAGFVIDWILVSGGGNFTFASGQTYWVRPSATNPNYAGGFGFSGTVTFQPGAVIKANRNSYLYFYGPISVQTGTSPVIFTAADDNAVGEVVSGSELVGQYAAQAFWSYYNNNSFTLTRFDFRYCQEAARFDSNPGEASNYTLTDCRFEECSTAIYRSGDYYVTVNNPMMCNVTTQKIGKVALNNVGSTGISG